MQLFLTLARALACALGSALATALLLAAPLSADEAQPPVVISPDQGFMQTLVMVGLALLFFYFILWRPEQKRRKAMDAQRNAMKKGDKVTAMGIIGTVSKIKEDTVVLRMIDGSEIEFLKAAISDVQSSVETPKE
jgi:preprotein translocase subunit YajC